MLRNRFLFSAIVLAALLGVSVVPVSAEHLQQRVARGNNVGLGIMTDWCMPMITASWTGNTIQYPKGSGNLILNDAWTVGMMTANDLDGDGAAEDTATLGSGGRDTMPYRCSIEAIDALTALATSGENMETAAGARSGTAFNRVWTSLDADELADWPVEARNPHTASGTPIIHGAETIFTHSGDVFNSWGAGLSGYYNGWSFYFLDFAENNSMVYVHEYFQNVSEYMKWNPTYGNDMWYAGGAAPPDGWTWKGAILFNNWRQMAFGNSGNLGWCYHPAKEIIGLWSTEPLVSDWTPQQPPLLGLKVLKYPELRGEVSGLINIHTPAGGEFGVAQENNLLAMGLSEKEIYQAVMNTKHLYAGQINPFTGREMTDGYPGVLLPSDSRYNQWIWGGASNWNHYTFWGEIHDVAPRDSFDLDWVIMFTPTGVTPLVAPTYDIPNIDDPMMQTAYAPLERWTSVAQTVYDGGFVVPATPAPPALTIIPGDREVTITWSDINLKTPDPYFSFLQEHPDLDPNGVYKEYDFEGFRLYRSFVGPNDSHSEMIWNSSVSGGNLSFVYVDKLQDDQPYFRMKNGMKVWYALVPYDLNYDPATEASFSLPDPTSGKAWNRAGEAGLYNAIPRSDASNYRAASANWSFTARGTVESIAATSVELTGNGALLTQDPVYLEPSAEIEFTPGINEKITSDQTIYIACTALAPNGNRAGRRYIALVNGSGGVLDDPGHDLRNMYTTVRGGWTNALVFQGGLSSDGATYSLSATFDNGRTGGSWIQVDSLYTGGKVWINTSSSDWTTLALPPYSGTGNYQALMRTGAFEITWKDAGGGMLSVDVHDRVQNKSLAFSPYIDDDNWGFIPQGVSANTFRTEFGVKWGGSTNVLTPKSARTAMLVDKVAASTTEDVRLMVSGVIIGLTGTPHTMPAVGTKITLITAFGDWNSDKTVFTQTPGPVYVGDKWQIDLKASTMNVEDIDLTKIKVVPNPYVASSFLDLSNTQRRIEFVNLPSRCTLRIYTLGGNLVNVINHVGANRSGWGNYTDWDRLTMGQPKEFSGWDNHSGTEPWNLRNRFGQTVASGLYFFHVTDERGQSYTGKFYIIN